MNRVTQKMVGGRFCVQRRRAPTELHTNSYTTDGMYRADLLCTTPDALDFYLPNGAFTDKRFELLSYISDDRTLVDSSAYLIPVGALPPSETQGLGRLEALGSVFTNMPTRPDRYIHRAQLHDELLRVLRLDRHQMVTLVGRGGVGKTSLALSVLHELAQAEDYAAILWFRGGFTTWNG